MIWEAIDEWRRRARVPLGWIYEHSEWVVHDLADRGLTGGWDSRTTCCYVFDPFHRWKIIRPEEV